MIIKVKYEDKIKETFGHIRYNLECKDFDCNTGRWLVMRDDITGLHNVYIDNDGHLSDYLVMLVQTSKYGKFRSKEEFDGWYDWKNGIYHKPFSRVFFTVE